MLQRLLNLTIITLNQAYLVSLVERAGAVHHLVHYHHRRGLLPDHRRPDAGDGDHIAGRRPGHDKLPDKVLAELADCRKINKNVPRVFPVFFRVFLVSFSCENEKRGDMLYCLSPL